jgi:hypothetical protein
MFFILQRKRRTEARGTRHSPRLEPLEDRTLLTLFMVSAVPDATAQEEAVASVTHSLGEAKVARASLFGEAAPAGQGTHHGAFYLGETDSLQIDTLPAIGQNLGDPITVAFAYSYTSTLQTLFGYPPVNPAYVAWHGYLDAGDASQLLFDGYFSTDSTPGDEIHEQGVIQINMNVGDHIAVQVWSDGEAFAAEPHYKNRVAFSADFSVNDFRDVTPLPADGGTASASLLAPDTHRPSAECRVRNAERGVGTAERGGRSAEGGAENAEFTPRSALPAPRSPSHRPAVHYGLAVALSDELPQNSEVFGGLA